MAVVALVLSVGCGGEEAKTDDGCGCGAAKTDDKGADDAAKTDGCGDEKGGTMKTDGGDAAKDVTYKCKCGKTKTVAAAGDPPS